MDLPVYWRVLKRFKWLVIIGLLLAIFFAVLSTAKITKNGLIYRKPAIWQSTSNVLLTQGGFPWGRATLPSTDFGTVSQYADPTRFSSLVDLYSQFANSDQVAKLMRSYGAPKSWKLVALPLQPTQVGAALPVISLEGQADTPGASIRAVQVGRQAFVNYVHQQQLGAAIPKDQRIDIQTLQLATLPKVIAPRKKTLPIVIFLALASATIGLAFVLDNAKPVTAKPINLSESARAERKTGSQPARSQAEA